MTEQTLLLILLIIALGNATAAPLGDYGTSVQEDINQTVKVGGSMNAFAIGDDSCARAHAGTIGYHSCE